MPIRDMDDDVQLGMLAVQTGLVAPEAVLAAARTPRPDDESLDKTLIRLGDLKPEEQTLLQSLKERLAARKLSSRPIGWSPELEAALSESLGGDAAAGPQSPDSIDEFVRRIGSPRTDSRPTPAGRRASRFRVIRLHARGGLGLVSLAIDEELRREVALKGRLGPLSRALAFSPDGRRLLAADERLRAWDLTPDAHAPDDLEKLVQLSAQREIDARGNLQFLSPVRIEALQRELSYKLPDDFKPAPGRIAKFAPTVD